MWAFVTLSRFKSAHIQQNIVGAGECVRSAELIKKRSLWGYRGDDWVIFIKLTISDPKSLPKVRDKCLTILS